MTDKHNAPATGQQQPSDERARIPQTPAEVIAFIGGHFDNMEESANLEDVRFRLSVHDLQSAFRWWFDDSLSSPSPAQQTDSMAVELRNRIMQRLAWMEAGQAVDVKELAADLRAVLSSPAQQTERQEAEARNEPSGEKCRYCGGDGEHYQGPSRYTDCEPCKGTGLAAAPASAEPVQVPGERIETSEAAIEWAQVFYRNAETFTLRDLGIVQAAWAEATRRARLAAPSSPSLGGTVDTPEFRAKLNAYLDEMDDETDAALIAHIDQHTAQAVRAEREKAAQWLLDNYQDYPNIASLCEVLRTPAVEQEGK